MMVKLFLCSYFAAVSSFTPQFVGGDLKGKKLAFIPTASLFEEYTDYVDEAKEAFENLGLNIEVLDVSSAPKDLIERTLQSCDLIYVSGGNTFYLLQELEKSGAKTIILEQVKGGQTLHWRVGRFNYYGTEHFVRKRHGCSRKGCTAIKIVRGFVTGRLLSAPPLQEFPFRRSYRKNACQICQAEVKTHHQPAGVVCKREPNHAYRG